MGATILEQQMGTALLGHALRMTARDRSGAEQPRASARAAPPFGRRKSRLETAQAEACGSKSALYCCPNRPATWLEPSEHKRPSSGDKPGPIHPKTLP